MTRHSTSINLGCALVSQLTSQRKSNTRSYPSTRTQEKKTIFSFFMFSWIFWVNKFIIHTFLVWCIDNTLKLVLYVFIESLKGGFQKPTCFLYKYMYIFMCLYVCECSFHGICGMIWKKLQILLWIHFNILIFYWILKETNPKIDIIFWKHIHTYMFL